MQQIPIILSFKHTVCDEEESRASIIEEIEVIAK